MTIIYFLIMLGVLIAIHEAGHMLTAKLFNIYVREFAIGFGPVIWKKQGKETLYSIRAIPLGGFTGMIESEEENVAQKVLEGSSESLESDSEAEQPQKPVVEESRTFYGAHPLKRIAVLLAGPLANLLLAIIVFVSIFLATGYDVVYPKAVVQQVMPNSAAEEVGIEAGDEIIFITYSNGERVHIESTYDVTINNEMHKGEMTVTVLRGDKTVDMKLTPRYDEESGRYLMGIVFSGETQQIKLTAGQAVARGVKYTFEIIGMTAKSIVLLLTGQIGTESISGTIGIYSYTQEAVQYGFISYLSLVGSISVSLGIMNLIPIPVFDGGRIVLTVIEMIVGHRLSKKVEQAVLTVGLVIIALLFILVTYNDIIKLFK
ncbi:MAG: RIP metalloprotease RseP [Erysipelotrichaceae bacterium]|nr:RIP metalloprotease RseP [Erysipelotrichaceae bacterium]